MRSPSFVGVEADSLAIISQEMNAESELKSAYMIVSCITDSSLRPASASKGSFSIAEQS
jgi:hypothetical protein